MFEIKDIPFLSDDTDDLFKFCLEETSDILETSTKKAIKMVSKSNLGDKVKTSKPKKSKSGKWMITSYPAGKTSDGTRAADVAFYLQYGTSNPGGKGVHTPSKPWLERATNDAESQSLQKIEKAYDEWMKKHNDM